MTSESFLFDCNVLLPSQQEVSNFPCTNFLFEGLCLSQVGLYEAQREATEAELTMLRKELAAAHAELRDKDNLIMRKDRAGGWRTLDVGLLLEKQMAAEKAANEKVPCPLDLSSHFAPSEKHRDTRDSRKGFNGAGIAQEVVSGVASISVSFVRGLDFTEETALDLSSSIFEEIITRPVKWESGQITKSTQVHGMENPQGNTTSPLHIRLQQELCFAVFMLVLKGLGAYLRTLLRPG